MRVAQESHSSTPVDMHASAAKQRASRPINLLMSAKSTNGFSVLHHRNFASYLSARVLATIAVQMQSVAIGWQVYALTGDVFDLGLIGLAQFAPFLMLILLAGHVADRYNRRNIILACFCVQ